MNNLTPPGSTTPTSDTELPALRRRIAELEARLDAQDQELTALHQHVERYAQILDAIPDMVLCKGPQSRIVYANRAFRDYYGMSDDQLQGLIDAPFNEPDYTLQYIKDDTFVFNTGTTLDIPQEPVTRHDGQVSLFHTVKSAIRNTNGTITHTVGVSRDITERQRAEQAFQDQVARLQRIAASVPGMVYQFVLNPDGTSSFPYVSDGCRELYEIEPADAQRDADLLLNAALPQSRQTLEQSIGESAQLLTPWNWEGQVRTPSGVTKWLQGAARPIRHADGRIMWDGLLVDISDRKAAELAQIRLQDEVIQAQRDALAELSTPLIPISDDVMVMPLVGSLDTRRAQEVMETLLEGVERERARTAIIDITGVPVVDTHVANTLIRAAQAVRLLGARVVLTGIRPEVAQTLVNLGVDLGDLTTRATLQSGVAEALRQRG